MKEDFKALPRNISKDLLIYRDSTMKNPKPADGIRLLSAVGDAFMRLESGTGILLFLSELYGLDQDRTDERPQQGLQLYSGLVKKFRAVHAFADENPNRSFLDLLLVRSQDVCLGSLSALGPTRR